MKRFERFAFQGRRYKFLNWEGDGTAHAIDLKIDEEVWLVGVALSRMARERDNAEWLRQRREALAASRQVKANWDRDMENNKARLAEESEQLLMTNPVLRAAVLHLLIHDQQSDDEVSASFGEATENPVDDQ